MSTRKNMRFPSCVFPLRSEEDALGTILCVHPGGIKMSCYDFILDALPDWNLLAVELGFLPSYQTAFDPITYRTLNHIEDIGSDLIKQLPETKGDKLVVAGWSFGGVIGSEVIHRIAPDKEKKLIVFDSLAPVSGNELTQENVSIHQVLQWFVQFLNALKGCKVKMNEALADSSHVTEFLTDLLEQAKAQNVFGERESVGGIRKLFSTFVDGLLKHGQLTSVYNPALIRESMLVFRSKTGLRPSVHDDLSDAMGWDELSSDVKVVALEEDHYSLMVNRDSLRLMGEKIMEFVEHETILETC